MGKGLLCYRPGWVLAKAEGEAKTGSQRSTGQETKMNQESYKDRYQQYLESDHWKQMRTGCFFRDGRRCLHCKSRQNLNAHHLRYRNLTDCYLDDVMTLFRRCHDAIHSHMGANQIAHNILDLPEVLSILASIRLVENNPSKPVRLKTKVKLTKSQIRANERSEALSEFRGVFPPAGPGPFTLTGAIMVLLMSDRGGFKGPVIRALGVRYPLKAGWMKAQTGKSITREKLVHAWQNRNGRPTRQFSVEKLSLKALRKKERKRLKTERRLAILAEQARHKIVPVNFKAA